MFQPANWPGVSWPGLGSDGEGDSASGCGGRGGGGVSAVCGAFGTEIGGGFGDSCSGAIPAAAVAGCGGSSSGATAGCGGSGEVPQSTDSLGPAPRGRGGGVLSGNLQVLHSTDSSGPKPTKPATGGKGAAGGAVSGAINAG